MRWKNNPQIYPSVLHKYKTNALKNCFFLFFSADLNGIPLETTIITTTTTTTTTIKPLVYVPAEGCKCSINLQNDGTFVLAFCNTWSDDYDIYWCYIVYPSSSCDDHDIFQVDTTTNMAKVQCYVQGINVFVVLIFDKYL